MLQLSRVAFALVLVAAALPASAIFRAYVSVTGNDANPCTLAAPCRLLPAALAAADVGGEVWILDSANYNSGTVSITKTVTILAVPGVVGSVVATGNFSAFIVNGAGIRVRLRNVNIVPLGSPGAGIVFAQGAALDVEDCDISSIPTQGISAQLSNAVVNVSRTRFRNNNTAIFASGAVKVFVNQSEFRGNSGAVGLQNGATLVISGSFISGGDAAISAIAAPSSPLIVATIESTVITGHAIAGVQMISFTPGRVQASITRSTVAHNADAVATQADAAGGVLVLFNDSTINYNTGKTVNAQSGPVTALTRGNNTIDNGGGDGASLLASGGR